MMDIYEMSEQEKTRALAWAMGWNHFIGQHTGQLYAKIDGIQHDCELYDPANMALAWRVHLWALQAKIWEDYYRWCRWSNATGAPWYARDDAQRAWLDKTLSLAIDAGLADSPARPDAVR
jgi:hypothetical protein